MLTIISFLTTIVIEVVIMSQEKNLQNYPLAYNSEYYTVMANEIIKGKQQSMTLMEARLIRLLITQVVKEDKDLRTYKCKITDLAKFLNITSDNLYRDMQSLCVKLTSRVVLVATDNPKEPWETFNWAKATYHGNGIITFKLSEDISKYVLELNKYFTQYQLKNILQMNSYYAIRLYELIKCEFGRLKEKEHIEFEIDYLREYFDLGKKFKNFGDFKRYVIEIAVKEINAKSDLLVEPEYLKTSRKITSIKFYVHYNIYNQVKGGNKYE